MTELPNPDAPKPTSHIPVYQQKANFFRVVHADGVWASVNMYENIHLAFYNENFAIPDTIYFPMNDKGDVGQEDTEKREGKKSWCREMEVDVVLSLEIAKQVQLALQNYIKIAEKMRANRMQPQQ